MENRILEFNPNQLPVWEDAEHLLFEVQAGFSTEIVKHGKTTAIEILAKILFFFLGQVHKARFGKVKERILENVFTVEPCDLKGLHVRAHSGHLAHHSQEKIFRTGIVVLPWALSFSIVGTWTVRKTEGHTSEGEFGVLLWHAVRFSRPGKQ